MWNRPSSHPVNAFVRNSTGLLELDRPKALNSLDHEMVDIVTSALDRWIDDDSIHRVVIYSSTEKAFCAGGDVRASRKAALEGNHGKSDQFFVDEYAMNDDLANFPKPIVAVINGIAMGGGLGISVHGSHRVITEKALAAMPEMAIGFIPDVGTTWMLQHMSSDHFGPSRAMANFLVVTGWRMSPADMLFTGLATDYVSSGDIDAFIDMVIAESLDEALEYYSAPRPIDSQLAAFADDIEATFCFDTWAEIQAALAECDNKKFVAIVEEHLKAANPTSVVAAIELMTANSKVKSLRKALDNEFAMGCALRHEDNFVEGVRAVLVDKDRNPSFSPATTDEVDVKTYRAIVA